MHWTGKWLGLRWQKGVYQCEDFVLDVMRAEFGRYIRRDLRDALEASWDRQLALHRDRHWTRTEDPQDGDAVLMVSTAGAGRRFFHVGVYAEADGAHVLHCPRDGESTVVPVHELAGLGLELEGYYTWRR